MELLSTKWPNLLWNLIKIRLFKVVLKIQKSSFCCIMTPLLRSGSLAEGYNRLVCRLVNCFACRYCMPHLAIYRYDVRSPSQLLSRMRWRAVNYLKIYALYLPKIFVYVFQTCLRNLFNWRHIPIKTQCSKIDIHKKLLRRVVAFSLLFRFRYEVKSVKMSQHLFFFSLTILIYLNCYISLILSNCLSCKLPHKNIRRTS